MKFVAVCDYVTDKLQRNLSPTLFYHGLHHTLDVVDAVRRIADAEGITDSEELILLCTAAYFHDLGFISTYKDHEEESCRIARATLPKFSYYPSQIETVCRMIMATKIPQNPENDLEKILADADLDYLGRDDFETIAQSLYDELREREMVGNMADWNKIQVKFLENHQYWTVSQKALRNGKKERHLGLLKRG